MQMHFILNCNVIVSVFNYNGSSEKTSLKVSERPTNQKHTGSPPYHRLAGAVVFVIGKCLQSFHAGVSWFSKNSVCVGLSVACCDLFWLHRDGSITAEWLL